MVVPHRLSIPDKLALGLAAGLAGTLVMTLGQHVEMRLSGRRPSRSPARAVATLGDMELASPDEERRASVPVHLAYGTALGIGLVALDRIKEPWRTAAFFAAVWGAGAALLGGLGLARPPHRQDRRTLATDLGHHAVYAATAGLAYGAANRFAGKRGLGRMAPAKSS